MEGLAFEADQRLSAVISVVLHSPSIATQTRQLVASGCPLGALMICIGMPGVQ